MATKLVIVESPAKAKAISGFLGADYDVEASVGHIRDLYKNSKAMPKELQKKSIGDFSVDVDNGFQPFYEVPSEKKKHVERLRAAMKGKDTLILATDEDREGESISWHLLELLKPGKGINIIRIAFHEITKQAILDALQHPRQIDMDLVFAQEARRILDRLTGYTLSPVLWSKVSKGLSAGRVQSPAVKLIVDREKERRNFKKAVYFNIKALLAAEGGSFEAKLKSVDSKRVVGGDDFDDSTGALKAEAQRACEDGRAVLLDQTAGEALSTAAQTAKPWKVAKIEQADGVEKPPAPFMTTSLQQEANRKLGFSADRTMRAAQSLYEGIEIGGETVGLITYMRTDSLTLADAALEATRAAIRRLYGQEYLPDKANRYVSKVRNAQEAHEAIRPTDPNRRPEDVERALSKDQAAVYELIWKRTMACQMKPALVHKTTVEVEVSAGGQWLAFSASGRQIKFPGFLRAYAEGSDDPEAELDSQERLLPPLAEGQDIEAKSVEATRHETKPPARYTDASLIKRLEQEGIGRPSTYASIISVIEGRDYVRKEGKVLIPTFKAFLAMEVLEGHFPEYMDLGFTARMDDALDEIANGTADSTAYLTQFFLGGDGRPGLRDAVADRKRGIPFATFQIGVHPADGEPILVRLYQNGGAFLQHGQDDRRSFASVPEDLPPAEVTVEKAVEMLAAKPDAPEVVGKDPVSGRGLLLKQKGGYYLEMEQTSEEVAAKAKRRFVSVPPEAGKDDLTQEVLDALCGLPRNLGTDPGTGEPVELKCGKFGMYIQSGKESRTVPDWRAALTMPLESALELLSQPKTSARTERAKAGPLKELGEHGGKAIKVMSGRFGPYVTDGEINATLPRTMAPETVTLEAAAEMIARKREAGPSKKVFRRKKKR